ncbi:hypothetical protein SESBI_18834 [Sesbania bispinosa]|nr:hypothetical protein SESBI_18834 [Sesbania bispinosa]
MEKKNKDQKHGSAWNQESQTNEPQNKQDKAQPNVTPGLSTKISSPSHDYTPNSNQQQQPSIIQWPYTPQNATEQLLAISIPTQAPLPRALNLWQQIPHPQQGQVFAQSTLPFWQPQPPSTGGPLLGANVPAIFQSFCDTGWHANPVVPGGTSLTTQSLVPNMCYHVGYTFPSFPGPGDSSSFLAQMHQLQHPYVHNFPGALGFSSATPWMPGCLASGEHAFQRGIIRPPAKLSQKHQQLWEAQSMENVQLWSLVNKLQAEVSDYKGRLMKLEEEVSSLKHKVEKPTNEVIGNIPVGTGQPSKRGRPKRSSASVNALHESQPQTRTRKSSLINKAQFEIKSPIFEKVILRKVENKEIANHSATTMVQQANSEKMSNVVTEVRGNIQVSQSNSLMSAYQGQVHQGIQMCGSGPDLSSTLGVKVNKDLKITYSELSQLDKVLNNSMDVSAKFIGNSGNGNLGWNCGIHSQDSTKDVLDVARQSLFHNGSVVQQVGNVTPGWNFGKEEGASEDDMVRSTKDENEMEMGDDTSS